MFLFSKKEINTNYLSDHYKDGKFFNEYVNYQIEYSKIPSMIWDSILHKSKDSVPKVEIPIVPLVSRDLVKLEDYSVMRLSHSTLLFKIEGEFLLTDPVFSERISPLSFIGPKRFHPTPIEIEALPPIKAVIISHDHYDHLDKESIKKLHPKVEKFYTSLGVGAILEDFGVPKSKIVELDWWDSIVVEPFVFIATPAQHFSGRGLLDHYDTLWSSWVIKTPKASFYFGADGGYFDGFKEIGERYGPFDMTFLEVGAYNLAWQEVHMMPEQSVQAHIDLKGKTIFPIHNGTFDLALHAWYEPFVRVDKEAQKREVPIVYPKMGEAISLINENNTSRWWR